jgi:predicted Zn-dependent protease
MIESLGCDIRAAAKSSEAAAACYRDALAAYPHHRALTYGYIDLLLEDRKPQAALPLIEERLRLYTDDYRMYMRQSRAYALLGKNHAQHRALGEAYYRMGNLTAAIEQLQIAAKSRDGDFYQMSAAEARLREFRRLDAENRKEQHKQDKEQPRDKPR